MKTMEQAVREMALLGAFVAFLGMGTVMLTADHPAGWFSTKCPRCERTEPTLPSPAILFKKASEMLPASPRGTERSGEVEPSAQTETTGGVAFRDECAAGTPTPTVRASFLR